MKSSVSFIILLFFLSFFVIPVNGQTETRDLEDFYSVDIIGNIRVEIYLSDKNRAELFLENTTPDKVFTEISNSDLSIRLRTDTPKEAKVSIKLYYKDLHKLSVTSGAIIISAMPLKGDDFEFNAKSGGKIDLELDLNSLTASASQGGLLSFTGKVQKQNINVTTGGTYSAYTLEAEDSYVKASSGGIAKVIARRIIDASANLKGFIGYKGNPVSVYVKTNLGGEIGIINDDRTE